ncbi:magnesium transporter NIPA-domain-containing protein [Phlyctochytrium arcticum]|nr:magnesium transporter NIPA-domain-containing protein [Phlyctochytrium arcticum]
MAGGNGRSGDVTAPGWHKAVGISLALSSATLIGVSFVIKKKGLINSNTLSGKPGQGHAYLKNAMWWTGMVLMLIGEVCNMAAYAFSPATLVTPLGALAVVISAGLSSLILKEHLSFSAKVGCAQCVLGATVLVLHAPVGSSTTTVTSFYKNVVSIAFLVWSGISVVAVATIVFYASPRWGSKQPIVPIAICSLVGSFVVIATQGFGSAIVYYVSNPGSESPFRDWRFYPLMIFILLSGIMQIHYLNMALNVFSTAVVTPIYYVCFTAATLVGSAILFGQFAVGSAVQAATVVLGFLVIVSFHLCHSFPLHWFNEFWIMQVGGVCLLFAFSSKVRRLEKLVEHPFTTDVGLVDTEADVYDSDQTAVQSSSETLRHGKSRVANHPPQLGYSPAGSLDATWN